MASAVRGRRAVESEVTAATTRPRIALSARQLEALRQAALHGSNRAVAAHAMGISMSTYRRHIDRGRDRLGVDNDVDAFLELGWLRVPDGPPVDR